MMNETKCLLALSAILVALTSNSASAAKIYSNNFSTATEQSQVADQSLGSGSIAFTSEQVVTGSTSLKLIDNDGVTTGGGNRGWASIDTSSIAGVGNLDKFTVVARFFIPSQGGNTEDNAQFAARSGFASGNEDNRFVQTGVTGFLGPGNLIVKDGGGFVDTGFTFPLDDWYTVAMSVDNTGSPNITKYYAASGTSLGLADFRAQGSINNSLDLIDRFEVLNANADSGDYYVDQLEIFDEVDQFVPEPSLGGLWLACLAWFGLRGRREGRSCRHLKP